jgi:hypothetical protein
MSSLTVDVVDSGNTVIVEEYGPVIEVSTDNIKVVEVEAGQGITLEVIDYPQAIVEVVSDESNIIEVVEKGPKGDKGDPGSATSLTNPYFTYDGDELSRVDYDNNIYKALQYDSSGSLEFLQFQNDGIITNRQFIYNPNGTLNNIIDS